jgi:D-glycero-D-manno-heptose 1,7-bisphosphate phosphatase
MNKAIFFDRDGTLNSNEGHYYVWKVADLQLNPGVAKALAMLKSRGYLLIVITNQGGISKGEYTFQDVDIFHKALRDALCQEGAGVDEIYYCPHHDSRENCLCRKPQPLMIEKAMARFHIDPALSFMVGDAPRDIEAGKTAGLQTILIESNSDLREILQKIP